jgi:DNA polymerase gamma 2
MRLIDKLSRIKQFVDLEQKNNVITVRNVTPLFNNVLNNVKNEYLKFHSSREPKIDSTFFDSTGEKDAIDYSSYLNNTHFLDAFVDFKENRELPFYIAEEIKEKNHSIECVDDGTLRIIFPKRHILRTSYFVSNSFSNESFHQMQRQHKIWWMKYGAYPGKYRISDQKSKEKYKFVNIQSTVTDFLINVENFKLFSIKEHIKDKEVLDKFLTKIPNHKKEVIPDVIKSVVDLNAATMALLFDAVNLTEYYTAFHRRIAPYQLSIICNGSKEYSDELSDLARYIELLITDTEPKIKVLNESNAKAYDERKLDKYCSTYDVMGIPYNILLDDESLDDGFLKLRNRNTTLSEKIHLSDVTNYLIKIFTSG